MILIAATLRTLIGLISGYYGGRVDLIVMSAIDVGNSLRDVLDSKSRSPAG